MSPSSRFETADVLAEGDFREGIRWLVLRGPFTTPVAYVGIPLDSPAAGLNTEFLDHTGPQPHGGWTFAGEGDGVHRPKGWWWWGWDYAHFGDWVPSIAGLDDHGHRWTTHEVVGQVQGLLPEFEVWLRSSPEEHAPADARKPPPTMKELTAMADDLFGSDWREGLPDVR